MRFVLNTLYDGPAGEIWVHEQSRWLQKAGCEATVNDWDHYDQYDIAIFMPMDHDIEKARSQNPQILIGVADPKLPADREVSSQADFLIVSSLEQRDTFLTYNPYIFIYYPFYDIRRIEKQQQPKDTIIIGYHGNKIHLHSFYPHITKALEKLGQTYQIELWALYNINYYGQWKIGVPDKKYVKTKHIQWSWENLYTYLTKADIGLVPALLPIQNLARLKRKAIISQRIFVDTPYDYLIRFKYSSNPGRIYTFSQLGIPVVTDFFPTASQFIRDGYDADRTGFIAYSAAGWYYALNRLASDHQLRQRCADNLSKYISTHASLEIITQNFIIFVEDLIQQRKNNVQKEKTYYVVPGFSTPELLRLKLQIFDEFVANCKRRLNRKLSAWYGSDGGQQ